MRVTDGRTNKQLKRMRDGRTVEIVVHDLSHNARRFNPRPPSCAALAEALPLFFKRKPCDDAPRYTAGGPLFSKLNSSQTTATAARALRPRGDDDDDGGTRGTRRKWSEVLLAPHVTSCGVSLTWSWLLVIEHIVSLDIRILWLSDFESFYLQEITFSLFLFLLLILKRRHQNFRFYI